MLYSYRLFERFLYLGNFGTFKAAYQKFSQFLSFLFNHPVANIFMMTELTRIINL